MMIHPDVALMLANDHRRELIAEADRQRLLSRAREALACRKRAAARGKPTGTLTPCEHSVAVSAR
ncbi:hypothetical protein [Actinoplanes sp. NPDC051851]|uniref:hypothetical protein n=1 Tax=Actinoplanes sp. NPDC051851 TaxID=3154753 RepID=UPI00343C4C04